MIDQIYNPYAFPRIKRKAARGIIGSGGPGAPGANRTQLQGSRQPIQRGPGRQVPRDITKKSVGQAEGQPQQQGGGLGGLLQGQKTYNDINDAYKGGQNIGSKLNSMGSDMYSRGQDAFTGLGNMFGNSSTLTNAGSNQLMQSSDMSNFFGGDTASRYAMPSGANGSLFREGGNAAFNFGGQTGATGLDAGMSEAMMGNPEIMGEGLSGLDSTTTGGAGSTPYLAYGNIALDVVDGGPQGQKITGNSYGDAALRVGAAYLTGGVSEFIYAFV